MLGITLKVDSMVPNRLNVAKPMWYTLKSIESRENERDSIERRTIERRSTDKIAWSQKISHDAVLKGTFIQ